MNPDFDLVFFDLEETVINSFANPTLINTEKLSKWLQFHHIRNIHIFSFAIWSDKDTDYFNFSIKPAIERALKVNILSAPSVKDMIRADYNLTGLYFDPDYEVSEYIQLRGKAQGFINYVNSGIAGNFVRATLIDDVVPNMRVQFYDNGSEVRLINVNNKVL